MSRGSRPENILRRAEEFVSVGQPTQALTLLHDALTSKRTKLTGITALESIVLRFVELGVESRKGKIVKEGLYQYKNYAQNISIPSIELIFKRFLTLSEEKVSEAVLLAGSSSSSRNDIDDLEAMETPESIIMSTVSGEDQRDRTDRAILTPWLKFLWEGYRSVLEIIRNNARLENLYAATALSAFTFCTTYERKTEFKRLCELLRNHLSTVQKHQGQAHTVNISEPETLQRFLDTRFHQLNAAITLELWQEAFKTIEDIYGLLHSSAKRTPLSPNMLLTYYENLAKVFLVGENYLMHAASLNQILKLNSSANTEGTEFLDTVLLAILVSELKADNRPRLVSLLNASEAPSRQSLLHSFINKGLLYKVSPEMKALYTLLEIEFHPLTFKRRFAPILAALPASLKGYRKPLHKIVLTRLFQELSTVYKEVKISFITSLADFGMSELFTVTEEEVEKALISASRSGELSLAIDHAKQTVIFRTALFKLENAENNDSVFGQLTRLSGALTEICGNELKRERTSSIVSKAKENIEKERVETLARKDAIIKRREEIESLVKQKELEEQKLRTQRQAEEREAEEQRLAEEQRRRVLERRKKDEEAIKAEEVRKFAEELRNKGSFKVDPDELKDLDTNQLRQMQIDQLERQSKDLNEKLRATAKRIDHLERGYRRREIPFLEKIFEGQQVEDKEIHERKQKLRAAASLERHQQALQKREQMRKLQTFANDFKSKIIKDRQQEFDDLSKRLQAEFEKAKKQRIAEARANYEADYKQKADKYKFDKEEAERREREEREAAEAEERQRRQLEEAKAKREAERKALDEQAQKQRDREREIEEKQERLRQEKLRGSSTQQPSESWRRPTQRSDSSNAFARSERPPQGAESSNAFQRSERTTQRSSSNLFGSGRPREERKENGDGQQDSERKPSSGSYVPVHLRKR